MLLTVSKLVLVVHVHCYTANCVFCQKLDWPKCLLSETNDDARKMTDVLDRREVLLSCICLDKLEFRLPMHRSLSPNYKDS